MLPLLWLESSSLLYVQKLLFNISKHHKFYDVLTHLYVRVLFQNQDLQLFTLSLKYPRDETKIYEFCSVLVD